jgi:hypothetical protein
MRGRAPKSIKSTRAPLSWTTDRMPSQELLKGGQRLSPTDEREQKIECYRRYAATYCSFRNVHHHHHHSAPCSDRSAQLLYSVTARGNLLFDEQRVPWSTPHKIVYPSKDSNDSRSRRRTSRQLCGLAEGQWSPLTDQGRLTMLIHRHDQIPPRFSFIRPRPRLTCRASPLAPTATPHVHRH